MPEVQQETGIPSSDLPACHCDEQIQNLAPTQDSEKTRLTTSPPCEIWDVKIWWAHGERRGIFFIVSPGLIEMMMCNGGLRRGPSVIFTPSAQGGVTLWLVLETLPTLQRSVWGGEVIIVYNAVLKWVRDLNIGSRVTPAPDTGGPVSPGTGEEAETGWKLGVVISPSLLCLSSDSQTTMNPNCSPAQAPPTQNNKWVAKCASGTWETGQTGGCVTLLEHLCIRA